MDPDQLRAAGFSDQEIKLHQAGFSDDEIKTATAPKKPATFLGTAGRALWNLPMDTAETLKGAMQQFGPEGLPAQAIMHPVQTFNAAKDTASHAADILTGGLQRGRDLSPAALQGDAPRMDTSAFDAFHDKYLTKEGIYKQVGDHPAGTALAIASILDPALKAGGVQGGIVGASGRGIMTATDAMKAAAAAPGQVGNALKSAIPGSTVSPTAALKTKASQLYDKAKRAGVVINGQSFANFADDARNLMREEGIDKDLHPDTTAALNRISGTPGDVSLSDLETLRKITGDATQATKPADKRLARILMDHIDDYAENLQPQNIIAGDAPLAVKYLKQARETWKNAARGETIDNLITKAKNNTDAFKSNLDANYRAQFKKLANNDRGMARFTPEQQDAIRKVAFGDGPVQSVLHTIGRIIPGSQTGVLTTSGVAAGAHLLGAPVAGPLGAVVAGAGVAGKVGSTLITSANARRAAEMARTGSKITPRSDAYYKIQQRRAARTASEQ
jgi:hypothetical protein